MLENYYNDISIRGATKKATDLGLVGMATQGSDLYLKKDDLTPTAFKTSLGIVKGKYDSKNTSLDPLLQVLVTQIVISAGNQTIIENALN